MVWPEEKNVMSHSANIMKKKKALSVNALIDTVMSPSSHVNFTLLCSYLGWQHEGLTSKKWLSGKVSKVL